MEQMVNFYVQYGWQLALIAFFGVVILGTLKYANVFKNVEKEKRKPIYFAISLGFSVITSAIYLIVMDQFTMTYITTVATATYALNQAMYAIYETTKLRDLVNKILDLIFIKKQ